MPTNSGEITVLLRRAGAGDAAAADALMPLVYDELRRIARGKMAGERRDHTLQPTALVHEAYFRLVEQTRVEWRDRAHFFGVAAAAMRRVLVDHARARLAAKRGDGAAVLSLDELEPAADEAKLEEVLFVHAAIDRLEELDAKQARVVEMHYFGGLTMQEVADALGVSRRTVHRDWAMAKSWLQREASGNPTSP